RHQRRPVFRRPGGPMSTQPLSHRDFIGQYHAELGTHAERLQAEKDRVDEIRNEAVRGHAKATSEATELHETEGHARHVAWQKRAADVLVPAVATWGADPTRKSTMALQKVFADLDAEAQHAIGAPIERELMFAMMQIFVDRDASCLPRM